MAESEKKKKQNTAKAKVYVLRFLLVAVLIGGLVWMVKHISKDMKGFSYRTSGGGEVKMFKE